MRERELDMYNDPSKIPGVCYYDDLDVSVPALAVGTGVRNGQEWPMPRGMGKPRDHRDNADVQGVHSTRH